MAIQPINGASAAIQPQEQTFKPIERSEYKPVERSEYIPVEKFEYKPIEATEGAKALSDEAIKKNIENLNELLKARQTNVTMEYDNLSSPKIVNIVDAVSGDVIRKMPPESVVEIAIKARDYVIGLMIDKTV